MSGGIFWGPYYTPGESVEWTTESSTTTSMPIEVEEERGGFHILEIHAPTAGISVFAIACGLVIVVLAYGCYRRCCFARIFGPTPPHYAPPPPPPTTTPAPTPAPAPGAQLEPLLQFMALQSAMNQPRMLTDQRFPPGRISSFEDEPEVVVHPPRASARFSKPPRPSTSPAAATKPSPVDLDL